jgi:hypothetical protein
MQKTLRRFALALTISFAAFGMLAFALEEEETLAGPALDFVEDLKGDADFGSCPANFPIEVHVKTDHKADTNGDHVICTDEVGKRFVDNDFFGDELGSSLVTGHGNFFDGGKKFEQDISFSFHGKNTGEGSKGFSEAAKGQFEYHDQTGLGPSLAVHGEVLCLSVVGNQAQFIGVVTNSNDLALPVDSKVVWIAVDNGEGINEPVDLVSRPSRLGKETPKDLPKDSCQVKFPEKPVLRLIVSGNIQVH